MVMETNTENMSLKERSIFLQKQYDFYVDTNKWVLVHVDGRSFSKMIKNRFNKPFDMYFMRAMDETAVFLCKNVQGAQIAYVQSDEISLLLRKNSPEGDIFFGGRLCKMQSIIASLATCYFNREMFMFDLWEAVTTTGESVDELPFYQFDCKVWGVDSANDAMAWFLYRNIDCVRNSKQQAAQTYLSHKELLGLNTDAQIAKLKKEQNIDWNDYAEGEKYGRLIYKEEKAHVGPEGVEYTRSVWKAHEGFDLTIPENRRLLEEICPAFL